MRKYNGKIKNSTKQNEYRRKLSIRKKVVGSTDKPRVCVNKTNKHLRKYFQNRNHLYKICAQLRCRWYFSHVFNK